LKKAQLPTDEIPSYTRQKLKSKDNLFHIKTHYQPYDKSEEGCRTRR
jgi:hypothetical protein